MFIEFNERRQIAELDSMLKKGQVEVQRRSSFSDWNYQAEVKALQSRLGEKFDGDLLMRALVMESHLEQERIKQEELGVEVTSLQGDNSELAVKGEKIIKTVLTRWLRTAYPLLPEEMITEVRQFLSTEEMLAEVGFHIGLREIILSEEYPPSAASIKQSLAAVIAALAETDPARAGQLVIDLVASQLQGQEIQEICSQSLVNPMKLLSSILSNSGLPPPESRLLFQTGPDTILASHNVGIFCNKQIIGQSFGETLEIAEEMAARDCLRNFFQTAEFSPPQPFGRGASRDNPNTG